MGLSRSVRVAAAAAAVTVAPLLAVAATAGSANAAYVGCSVAVSSTSLVPGQSASVDAEGNCFAPGTAVTVTIESTPVVVATGTSAGDGSFSASFVVPTSLPLGDHTLVLSGTNLLGHPQVLSVSITLVASAAEAAASSSGSGVLAFTGQNSGTWLAIAAALMALGAALTVSLRRRRSTRAAA